MSVRVMSLVWDSNVPAPERFTLLALADRADEDGRCWPSIRTLSLKCRMGASTIRRHLVTLQECGVLTVDHRFNSSSMYTISLGKLRELVDPATPSQSDTPSQSGRGSQSDTPSQSDKPPPPNLGGPPSQSEHLYTSDPSVDPSELPLAPLAAPVDRFAEFYAAYPRRKDRRKAEQAWRAALKRKADPDRIIAAAKAYAQSAGDVQYLKYPATWLNAEAYDDEPEPARLSLVPTGPVTFAELRLNGDVETAGRLIRKPFVEPAQPPSDKTPPREWMHARRVAWIDEHAQRIHAALTERKTG